MAANGGPSHGMWSAKEEGGASENDKVLGVTGKIAGAWVGLGGPDMELEEPCQKILAL